MLDVGGASDCFFSYHMNTHSIGVQYMRNNPGRFTASNIDHSWLRYLAYMSHQGTWADAIVIQAVADALNLTNHIIESNPGFASVASSNICLVSSETDTTVINIGHLAEIHCSTVPFNEEAITNNVICNNQPAQLTIDHCRMTNNNETVAVTKEQEGKAYVKEYIATKRRDKEFRNKQNRAPQAKRSENIEKKRESKRQAFNRRKESNSDHIRVLNRDAFAKSKNRSAMRTCVLCWVLAVPPWGLVLCRFGCKFNSTI